MKKVILLVLVALLAFAALAEEGQYPVATIRVETWGETYAAEKINP